MALVSYSASRRQWCPDDGSAGKGVFATHPSSLCSLPREKLNSYWLSSALHSHKHRHTGSHTRACTQRHWPFRGSVPAAPLPSGGLRCFAVSSSCLYLHSVVISYTLFLSSLGLEPLPFPTLIYPGPILTCWFVKFWIERLRFRQS